MFRKFRIAALSALLGFGTLAAMPAGAQADSIYFSFGGHGARAGVHIGDYPRYHRDRRHRHSYRRHHRRHYARSCTPREAVHKARRMGVHHARVARVNRNIIRVTGRKHRYRTAIIFARAPHCPVIRYR